MVRQGTHSVTPPYCCGGVMLCVPFAVSCWAADVELPLGVVGGSHCVCLLTIARSALDQTLLHRWTSRPSTPSRASQRSPSEALDTRIRSTPAALLSSSTTTSPFILQQRACQTISVGVILWFHRGYGGSQRHNPPVDRGFLCWSHALHVIHDDGPTPFA
jgi:hypothetical protein